MTQELWIACRRCNHRWFGARLPMEMGKVGRLLKRATCPICGEREQLFVSEPPATAAAPREEGEAG